VVEEPPEEKKPTKKTDLKRLLSVLNRTNIVIVFADMLLIVRSEQADGLLADIKGGSIDGLKALSNYVTTTSIYGEKDTQIIDPGFILCY